MMNSQDFELEYQKLAALKKMKGDVGLFGRMMFPTAFSEKSPPFHKEILDTVRDESIPRVLCAAPRRTAKSTIMSFLYPAWRIAFKKSNEGLFILIISESRAQSINFLTRLKTHLTDSKEFVAMFGNIGADTATTWREDSVVFGNGARVVAAGAGQSLRGLIHVDDRPNLIIVDDFESEKNAYTAEGRAKNRKWLTEAVIPSLAKNGRLIMVGTVISEDCFLFWAKESPAWRTLWYTIWDDNEIPVWPEMYTRKEIIALRDDMASVGNLAGFYQEYMNQPQAPGDAPFKPKYMKIHHKKYKKIAGQNCLVQLQGEEEVITPVELYAGIDPASSLSRHADYFVIATVAMDHGGNVYIVDIERSRTNPAEQPQLIIDAFKKYSPRRMKVETVGYQEALRQHTRKLMRDEGIYIPGLEKGVKPRNSKSERLLSLVPLFAQGKFFFRPQDLEPQKEFLSYPKGKHDDVMDAVHMALDGARPCRKEKLNPSKKDDTNILSKVIDWMTV